MLSLWPWVLFLFLLAATLIVLFLRQAYDVKRELADLLKRLDIMENRVNEGLSSFESLRQMITDEANPNLGKSVNRLFELRKRIDLLQSEIITNSHHPWYHLTAFRKSVLKWINEEKKIFTLVQSELRLISSISMLNTVSKEQVSALKGRLLALSNKHQQLVNNLRMPLSQIGAALADLEKQLHVAEQKHMYDTITVQHLIISIDMKCKQIEKDLSDVRLYYTLLQSYQRMIHNDIYAEGADNRENTYHHMMVHLSDGDMDSVRELYKQAEVSHGEPDCTSVVPSAVKNDDHEGLSFTVQQLEGELQEILHKKQKVDEGYQLISDKYTGQQYSELQPKIKDIDNELKFIAQQISQLYLKNDQGISEEGKARFLAEQYEHRLKTAECSLIDIHRIIQSMEERLLELRREFSILSDRYICMCNDLKKKGIEPAENSALADDQEQIHALLLDIQSHLMRTPYHLENIQTSMFMLRKKLYKFVEEAYRQIRAKDEVYRRMTRLSNEHDKIISDGRASGHQVEQLSSMYDLKIKRLNELMSKALYLESNLELDQWEEMLARIQREILSKNKDDNL
ncbi:hypothetical protein [Paenibacillus dakarensis]|uniref:hypothetical protein n=1 Tax=Paenibacillus dakarensis TaxID=1527293 RepID=UPI0006D567C2|nr:hypothetical protein [Paenibacillus dakarensis]